MARTSGVTSDGIRGTTIEGWPSKTSRIGRTRRLYSRRERISSAWLTSASPAHLTRLGTPRLYERQIASNVSGAELLSHNPRNATIGRERASWLVVGITRLLRALPARHEKG